MAEENIFAGEPSHNLSGWRPYASSTEDASPVEPPFGKHLVDTFMADVVVDSQRRISCIEDQMVYLVRDVSNPGDQVEVLNMQYELLGLLDKSTASLFSPIMDDESITIQGLLHKALPHYLGTHIRCELEVFAKVKEEVGYIRDVIVRGPGALERLVSRSHGPVVDRNTRSLDFFAISNDFAATSLDPPCSIIKAQLLPHQKEGLFWLVRRENLGEMPPFWEVGNGEYINILTGDKSSERPPSIRGGIFADEIGTGKTVTLLSLIAHDKMMILQDKGQLEIDSGLTKKRKLDGMSVGESSSSSRTSPMAPTLIVFPNNVYMSWITQIQEHTVADSLKVYFFYGTRISISAPELTKNDIVLTTYGTLASEYNKRESSVIMGIDWRRVILDEAHVLRNVKSVQTKAAWSLKAERKWAVTGTFIQNNSWALFSFMTLLRFEPFCFGTLWYNLIVKPLLERNEIGNYRLQTLMAYICLRRTKEASFVGLPPKCYELYPVILSGDECDKYRQMEKEARETIEAMSKHNIVSTNQSILLGIIMPLRRMCTDQALCTADLSPLKDGKQQLNPDLLQTLLSVIEDMEYAECAICLSPPVNAMITHCKHILCCICILRNIRGAKRNTCPMCRQYLSEAGLFKAPQRLNLTQGPYVPSSKVAALAKLLLESRVRTPLAKSVIFSQFTALLMFIEGHLKTFGFNVVRLSDAANAATVTRVINDFKIPAPDGPTILLASVRSAETSINLTAASTVYLMEPWWNPQVEEQVVERVHTVGQMSAVKVVRFIATGTIDETILQLQEKKKQVLTKWNSSVIKSSKKTLKGQSRITKDDVRFLMRM
ncbi:putative swi/snf-related matrix-associated actin-dependent regulator of chromatin subfamily a member 3-like 1 [Phtheirospermum japonicum]|uniref:Putative swi/snf-related matrix-associated actin-dependent regulator of chromatin subfamily a member 3-like 1 n=1 Tax=Phtheirospermum japonicum TaxID=374723 RepID=A0A830BSJ2_9LAMI|nr:putative swi/snf-related matrix-associated actin-dependent regulator of chromatin subfamily a member 3-like 1 [Phtheirospermum japonicum]